MRILRIPLGTACLVLCGASTVLAYQITSWVASGGAHTGSSASYQMAATVDQPSPIGISTGGAAYDLSHGFWHTVSRPSPLIPVLHIARLNATQAELWWNAIAGATAYRLYRSTEASFVPGTHWQQLTGTSHAFSQGIGDPTTNYFFLCRSVGAWEESDDSNRVGEFDFGSTGVARTAEERGSPSAALRAGGGAEGQRGKGAREQDVERPTSNAKRATPGGRQTFQHSNIPTLRGEGVGVRGEGGAS